MTRPRKLRWYLHNAMAEWTGDWVEYLQAKKEASRRVVEARSGGVR